MKGRRLVGSKRHCQRAVAVVCSFQVSVDQTRSNFPFPGFRLLRNENNFVKKYASWPASKLAPKHMGSPSPTVEYTRRASVCEICSENQLLCNACRLRLRN